MIFATVHLYFSLEKPFVIYKKGLAFCEILTEFIEEKPRSQEFLQQIESSNLSYSNCLKNLQFILQELKTIMPIPDYLDCVTASELYEVLIHISS